MADEPSWTPEREMSHAERRSSGLVILDAPSNLGLRPPAPGREPGCRRLARVLREHGLRDSLGAEDGGIVEPPPYSPAFDSATGVRNGDRIPAYSVALADRIETLVSVRSRPIILGGDCSILLGAALGLRRLGTYGLAFLDGHLDFRHPGNAPAVGAVAGEDLAIVTGRGAPQLTDIEGRGPYIADDHVVAIGFREGPAQGDSLDILETPIRLLSIDEVRARGLGATAVEARAALESLATAGFWIHLDVDVLDPQIMPAVDSPEPPGGLTFDELRELVRTLWSSPIAVGIDVTVFDPDLDVDGTLARSLVDLLSGALHGDPSSL